MNTTLTYPSLVKMFRFPFKDPRWQPKLLIAAGLMLANFIIPIVPTLFFYGYLYRISRQVVGGENEPLLPEWTDWERLLKEGLRLYGGLIIWGIPGGLFMGLASLLLVLPAALLPLATFADQFNNGMNLFMLLSFAGYAVLMFGNLLTLIMGIIHPVIWGRVVAEERFAAVLEVRQWWAVFRANLAGCLVAYALVTGILTVLTFAVSALVLTLVLCAVVPVLLAAVMTYMLIVQSVLFTRVYLDGAGKLGAQPGI